MLRSLPIAASLALLALPTSAPANDIVDFFRAVSGRPAYHAAPPVTHVARHHGDLHAHDLYHPTAHSVRPRTLRRAPAPVVSRRSGFSFNVGIGNTPPVPVIAPQPVHAPAIGAPIIPGPVVSAPVHQIGDIVTCPVALAPHVVVKDADEIAPGAVHVVVAVRDPNLGRYRSRGCVEQLAYVQVCVPPCPVRRVRVSPCRTRVRLDYGRYEVDIVSRNGCIEVDYDN